VLPVVHRTTPTLTRHDGRRQRINGGAYGAHGRGVGGRGTDEWTRSAGSGRCAALAQDGAWHAAELAVDREGRATYTPFVRRRQFAAVAAATRDRIDVGCRYTDPPASDLLRPANAPGQATHRFSVTSVDGITSDVEHLLRAAYDQNG
jgi:hypothetical protein